MSTEDSHVTRPVEFIVDRSIYDESSLFLQPTPLEALVRPDLRYHFSGPTCAAYWHALCQQPEYAHQRLVRLIDSHFPDALRAAYSGSGPGGRMRMVSFGPGNGDVDVRLLAHLERAFDIAGYVCVDSSFDLLRMAVARVANATELRARFAIESLCADFMRLKPRPAGDGFRLLTLLGGTLGNYNERLLLDQIRQWMSTDCRLFVDAWLSNLSGSNGSSDLTADERSALTEGLTFAARNRFTFGPVEVATTATAGDVSFGHDVNRDTTVVPGAFNVVTYCSGLRTRMRLNNEPIERSRLPLASTTIYQFDELRTWLGTSGFEVCWHAKADRVGLFLLRRR